MNPLLTTALMLLTHSGYADPPYGAYDTQDRREVRRDARELRDDFMDLRELSSLRHQLGLMRRGPGEYHRMRSFDAQLLGYIDREIAEGRRELARDRRELRRGEHRGRRDVWDDARDLRGERRSLERLTFLRAEAERLYGRPGPVAMRRREALLDALAQVARGEVRDGFREIREDRRGSERAAPSYVQTY